MPSLSLYIYLLNLPGKSKCHIGAHLLQVQSFPKSGSEACICWGVIWPQITYYFIVHRHVSWQISLILMKRLGLCKTCLTGDSKDFQKLHKKKTSFTQLTGIIGGSHWERWAWLTEALPHTPGYHLQSITFGWWLILGRRMHNPPHQIEQDHSEGSGVNCIHLLTHKTFISKNFYK